MKKALLLIDIQNDYFPDGKATLVGAEKALENAEIALKLFRKKKYPIIHVQHFSTTAEDTFFLPGTQGVKIHERLSPKPGEHLVIKHFPSSFYQTNLLSIIQDNQIGELVVCGMMTHMCVDTTVRAAKDYALPVTLLHDACATKNLSFEQETVLAKQVQASYMAALSGIFAQIIPTNELSRILA